MASVLQAAYFGTKALFSIHNESCGLQSLRSDCGNVFNWWDLPVLEARLLSAAATNTEFPPDSFQRPCFC